MVSSNQSVVSINQVKDLIVQGALTVAAKLCICRTQAKPIGLRPYPAVYLPPLARVSSNWADTTNKWTSGAEKISNYLLELGCAVAPFTSSLVLELAMFFDAGGRTGKVARLPLKTPFAWPMYGWMNSRFIFSTSDPKLNRLNTAI